MSLILDALRKSERTRQQTLTGQLSATDAVPRRAHIPVPWATLIGILLLANAIVLTIIFWRTHAGPSAGVAIQTQQPAAAASTITTPSYRPAIRSLATEAAGSNPTGAAAPAAGPGTASATTLQTMTPVTTPARTPLTAATPAIAASLNPPIEGASTDSAPALDSLPFAFQQSVPPLHLDVHGYAEKPADRFVVINMQRYQSGETLKEGPRIIAITSQGVVLEYNGQKFLLPRP